MPAKKKTTRTKTEVKPKKVRKGGYSGAYEAASGGKDRIGSSVGMAAVFGTLDKLGLSPRAKEEKRMKSIDGWTGASNMQTTYKKKKPTKKKK